jgi:crotonobetainyl-CoA:carnitine CoA-transferase CaiB-like acyl-CoA transferase
LIWAPVLTLAEAVDDPQANAFGSFPTVEHPTEGAFRTVAPPLQMSGHALDGIQPAPALSADTEAVLRELGMSEDDIALLLAASK